jgi:hypothetical protein
MGGGAGATGVNRGMSFNNRPAHADHLDLSRSKSQGSRSLGDPMTASTGDFIPIRHQGASLMRHITSLGSRVIVRLKGIRYPGGCLA